MLKTELLVAPAGFPKKLCCASPAVFSLGPRYEEIVVGSFTKFKGWWHLKLLFKLSSQCCF